MCRWGSLFSPPAITPCCATGFRLLPANHLAAKGWSIQLRVSALTPKRTAVTSGMSGFPTVRDRRFGTIPYMPFTKNIYFWLPRAPLSCALSKDFTRASCSTCAGTATHKVIAAHCGGGACQEIFICQRFLLSGIVFHKSETMSRLFSMIFFLTTERLSSIVPSHETKYLQVGKNQGRKKVIKGCVLPIPEP